VAASETTFETIEDALRRCLTFLTDCQTAYLDAPKQERRHMNQAVFDRFLVGEDGTTDAEPTGAFGILLAPDLLIRQSSKKANRRNRLAQAVHRPREWRDGLPAWLHEDRDRVPAALKEESRPAFV